MVLVLLAAVLARQDELPFPVYERDPWGGLGAGSFVTRLTVLGKVRSEETLTLKAVDKDSKTLVLARPGQDDDEQSIKFIAFTDGLVAPGRGYQPGGRSNRQVPIGDKRVKALVREYIPTQLALDLWRITTTSEAPGGIYEIVWKAEDDVTKTDVTYTLKGFETLKVGGVPFECAKIDMTATETKKKKRKVEASYWISEKIPGFLVRSRIKDTIDRVTTETAMDVIKFESKKP